MALSERPRALSSGIAFARLVIDADLELHRTIKGHFVNRKQNSQSRTII